MKSNFINYFIALVAMFCCVLSAHAETTYTGVTPVSGKTYYLYCPASKTFITPADDSFLEEVERYGNIILVSSTANTPTKVWYYSEDSEGNQTLAGKYGENDYRYLYGGATLDDVERNDGIIFQDKSGFGEETSYFGLSTEKYSVSIEKNGDYYTISSGGYLCIKQGNISKESSKSEYTNFIFVAAESESSEEHVHSLQYDFGNNGQHSVTCSGCEYKTTEACADNDNDYKCDKCGVNLCKHTNGTVYETSNGVHVVKCGTCGTKLGEASCTMAWVSNNDGTHKHQCSVCKNVTESGVCQDGNSNDKCDNCGYDMSQSGEETTVTGVDPVSGKSYFIYCPAQKQYFVPSLIQNPTNDIKGFAGFVDSNPETAWYCNEVGEGNITLSFKNGDNTYYVSYEEITDGITYGVNKSQFGNNGSANFYFILTTYSGSLEIVKEGNYYSIDGMEQVYPSNITDYSKLIFIEATAANLKVSAAAGWGTFVAPFSVIIPDNVEAYKISEIESGNITYAKVAGVRLAANTPVVLQNTGDEDVNVWVYGIPTGTPNENADNYLVGVYKESTVDEGNWLLQKQNDVVGFYPIKTTGGITVKANKCYLSYSESGAKSLTFSFNDATAITSTSTNAEVEAIYSPSGAKLSSMQKGINIVKMSDNKVKKVIVK